MNLKVLLLEDSETDADLITRQLTRDKLNITAARVDTRDEFVNSITTFKPDIILSDHSLPQFNSLAALEIAQRELPNVPFILVTGTVSEEFAVACIKAGADDYILKSNLARLSSSIKHSLEKRNLETENIIIKRLNAEIKEKNKDITDSINYALRLQQALMQAKGELLDIFPQSFILLRPKHILSGDFYWFKKTDDHCMVAAADCTGHGVPGALLTILGMNILHSALGAHKTSSPSSLLKLLDADMHRKLNHKKNGTVINDGMDIAICDIDRKKMTLTVSGANSDVYLVHDGDIKHITTDKYFIGSGDETKEFETRHILLKKGDTIYLSSDGFRDQFGGGQSKKMGSARFRELLLSLSEVDFPKQEETLRSALAIWQGNEEQTDDILVMGIRI